MKPGRWSYFGMLFLCGLSLSLGWGIRGNFGHAYGAMIPGALAALAIVLTSGREDWWRRTPYFALFGAVAWSFGGTISYMWVIAYTHSGHLPSQAYGFACLFVIGFLWAALGGAGTALPACLDRERLTGLFVPMLVVFGAWAVQDLLPLLHLGDWAECTGSQFVQALVLPFDPPRLVASLRHESPLYWYDTNWFSILVALVAVLVLCLVRRRVDFGSSLILHLTMGWWLTFLAMVLLVDGLGIEFRMTPPRGDNWAGVLGMTVGAFVFLVRHRLFAVVHASLLCGIVGGFGFATATFLKLAEIKGVPPMLSALFAGGEWQTNWHSVLEQTYGLINGIGLAAAMAYLARRAPVATDESRQRRWTEVVAVAFVLLVVTYLNLVKLVPNWVQFKAVPAQLYGTSSRVWFNLAYAVLAAAVLVLLISHQRRPLSVLPTTSLGKAQLLYLIFLWWVVVGNLMKAVPPFGAERLITEGVIHVNAVVCSLLAMLGPRRGSLPDLESEKTSGRTLAALALAGVVALVTTAALETAGTRWLHGDAVVGGRKHARFGPDAQTGKPERGKPHP